MAKAVKKFRSWLANQRNFLFNKYSEDARETQEPERSLIELPPEVRTKLIDRVNSLPSNPTDKQAIATTLDEKYDSWREDPQNADNSVVVLSSPVVAVSRILSETLEEWAEQKQVPLKLVSLNGRPKDITTVKSQLEQSLPQYSPKELLHQLEIVVIPNLSWFFLRSLEGFEGIEYIQSLLCDSSQNRFWIIGSGQVAWQYLNSVCSLEAYCGEVFALPAIESEDFQAWFAPLVKKLDISFDEPRIDRQILDGQKDNKASYFNHLADISQGVATVAVQVFLKSISYEKLDKPAKSILVAQAPKLPQLPDFESADRYLLYSLLLHGDLTIDSLAESLGDLASEVQTRVQLLRREGVVEQQKDILKINPIHYARLKQELAGNNFVIDKQ